MLHRRHSLDMSPKTNSSSSSSSSEAIISGDSTPRCANSYLNIFSSESDQKNQNMPDLLVADGGGDGGTRGAPSGISTDGAFQRDFMSNIQQAESVMEDLRKLYEDELRQYDNYEPKEAARLRELLYKRWLSDQEAQNRQLMATIADLEFEVENRLEEMENRMQEEQNKREAEGSQAQRIHRLESDIRALVRLIRRHQSEGVWRTEGIELQDKQFNDVLKPKNGSLNRPDVDCKIRVQLQDNQGNDQVNSLLFNRIPVSHVISGVMAVASGNIGLGGGGKVRICQRRRSTKNISKTMENNKQQGNRSQVTCTAMRGSTTNQGMEKEKNGKDRTNNELIITHEEVNVKEFNSLAGKRNISFPQPVHVEIATRQRGEPEGQQQRIGNGDEAEQDIDWRWKYEKLKMENNDLNKKLLDNRVLATEVAEKHDQIQRLKTEVNQLEENLRQAYMQTHFKDDVIKELRRDCRNLMNPQAAETKRSISVCIIPKANELEVPKTQAEARREKRKEQQDAFIKDLAIILEVLEDQPHASSEPLEQRILGGLKQMKERWLKVQEERDVLKNNNLEMESKLGQLLTDNMDLGRKNQNVKHEALRNMENQRAHLLRLKHTMVASSGTECVQLQSQTIQNDQVVGVDVVEEEEGDEDFIVSDTNRILLDANQMLIDLKNEIDKKNSLIATNSLLVEGLKEEVTRKTENLEVLRSGHKKEIYEKDKLIIDLENSIRNHNNRIEDLEVEKLKLENEVLELRRTVEDNLTSDQLQKVTTHKNKLEIECANQKMTISNLKDALESLKRESVSHNNGSQRQHHTNSSTANHHHQQRNLWNWLKNSHDI